MPPGIVPHCYDAARDRSTNAFHLLLEDLGETHALVTEWPLPPTLEQCERIVDLYARLHAAWWDDPRLGVEVGRFMDDAAIAEWREAYAKRFATFADRLGDRLPPGRRRVYERVLAFWSGLLHAIVPAVISRSSTATPTCGTRCILWMAPLTPRA